ncbi:RNA-dependent RNA polymerase [Alphacytorhabdovirus alphapogostemi]|uniref:Replicase n=1 Tax=Patchouli chlorosis-associated cytorhabdovirus TaxID=2979813 RepID=A0A977PMC6_9RHAB|nr:RNA-dependent RNA polymerase [Patchouli chlorosis-associated cytorhabdovirus]
MDFISKLNEDTEELCQTQVETPLSDYHLRNPVKKLDWWERERLPSRQYRDRVRIRQSLPNAKPMEDPSKAHAMLATYIPSMDNGKLKEAIGDLWYRFRMDNGILPRGSRAPIGNIIKAVGNSSKLYWDGMRFWNKVLLFMNANSSNRKTPSGQNEIPSVLPVLRGGRVMIYRVCVAVVTEDCPQGAVLDGDWVRMLSDMYTQRWLVKISAAIGREINPYHYPSDAIIDEIYAWGDKVLRGLGNEGFAVIKVFESLVVGYLQCKGENELVPADRFLRNTLKDLRSSSVVYSSYAAELLRILQKLDNKHHITQIYGLHRSWGHPTVDSLAGMEKLMKIGKKDIIKNNLLSINAGRMFKLLFCKEYRAKFGSYPKIYESGTLLATELQVNDPSAVNKRLHELEEWDRIKFRQTYKLPESFNLSMIVADKAISPTRSELVDCIKRKNTVMDSDLRRGVKRWLNDRSLDPVLFLQRVNDGLFPKDSLIIGLTPKERELNRIPRMFSLMSHLLRVYVVVTEQLLSDHILEMFPQITMTDSLLDLTRKMYNTVRNQSSLKKRFSKDRGWASKTVCISLDFEKWNGHMRKEMTSGVFTAIGDLFGLSELYNATYDLFSESYYYLADGSYIPSISESGDLVVEEPASFVHHKGGMEGLRQKGWTLYTVCGLEVILSKYDCEYRIMGMGDNQVLQITVYSNLVDESGRSTSEGISQMSQTLKLIFDDLVSSFTDSGLPLKPLETWMSEDLYLYGKVPIWRGVPLTMDLKKLMRTFPMSNEGVMTLENALSTVSSNAMAATQVSPCIWTAYCVYILMTSICIEDFLDYHPIIGDSLYKVGCERGYWLLSSTKFSAIRYPLPKDSWTMPRRSLRRAISIIPKSLSGYCGANIYEMMVRGFSDRLSRDLSYLNNILISPSTPGATCDLLRKWISPLYMPDCNYAMLLEDVSAVNLLSPRSPLSGVRQVVQRYLNQGMKIENPEFLQLVRAKNEEDCRYLAECLCEGKELHLRLLHDVFDATIYGYVDSIVSKVTKTTTIQKLAIQSDSVKVFDTIVKDEINYFAFFIWRCYQSGDTLPTSCATAQCKIIRERGWKKIIRGVTTPFPLSYMIETDCNADTGCRCEDGFVSIHYPDKQMPDEQWNFDIGGNPPYLGSMTKEKVVVGTGGKIYSAEPLIRRPIRLLRTINWFVPPDSRMAKTIERCVSSVTDLEISKFKGMEEGTAGSEAHRYQDSSTFRGALTSSNYLYSTRCHISTDNLVRYSKGAENTDFHYQATFCVILELSNMYVSNQIREGDVIVRFKHFKQCCYDCIHPIDEDFIDLNNDKSLSAIPSFKGNPYLYTPYHKIRILERISPLYEVSDREFSNDLYERLSPRKKSVLLHRSICDRIVKDIVTGRKSDTHVSVGLTSVKAYERTMYFKLNPRIMLDTVMWELRRMSEWTVLRSHPDRTKVTGSEVERVMIDTLNSADSHGFLGLAMFYCWEETAKAYCKSYPELVPPTTNPVSIASACESVRLSLIALIDRNIVHGIPRPELILEEEKDNKVIFKTLIINSLEKATSCSACISYVKRLETNDVWRDIKFQSCHYGHKLSDWFPRFPWIKSYITVERLRKDCESLLPQENAKRMAMRGCTVKNNFVTTLLSSENLRIRPETRVRNIPVNPDNDMSSGYTSFHLMTLASYPTSTAYKMQDILGGCGVRVAEKKCFCIGDGLGTSSSVLSAMGASEVISSTMLEPDDAIPHAYSHNVSPVPQFYGISNVNSSFASDRHNDVRSSIWETDWKNELRDCDVLYSDIEIVNRDDWESRQTAVFKIANSGMRSVTVIKDYIWSQEELANRLGAIWPSRARSWQLVTTRFRSHHYPEVWWILKDTSPYTSGDLLYPFSDKLSSIWIGFKRALNDTVYDISREDNLLISSLHSPLMLTKMVSVVKSWAVYDLMGSLLPQDGHFTSLYYYLLKAKRPFSIKSSDDSKHKLYKSDYLEIRTKMFAIAVSMLASIDDRLDMIRNSGQWTLSWKRYADKWDIRLKRNDEISEPECDVIKYVPTLNMMMREQGLLFEERKDTVEFKYTKNRKELCFPVTALSASLRKE